VPLTPTSTLVADACANGSAVAAFNVITLEHVEAVVRGAEDAGAPVVVQISENAVKFHAGRPVPLTRAAAALAQAAAVPVGLHLDHVTDMALLRQAADAGFSSAMFDAGHEPYPDNVAHTTAAADWAHANGLWLEAELGYVGGKPDSPASAHAAGVRTDVTEARQYVHDTGVDALAVAVGSSHAMTTRTAALDHDLIAALAAALPVPLVLHGSSGVPDEELARAVTAGMRKINIGTALNMAYTRSVRHSLDADPKVVDPRKYLAGARTEMAAVVGHLLHTITGQTARADRTLAG
jgi:fructose-bisphosphate aldolase, class II